jgi:hypothetical protein
MPAFRVTVKVPEQPVTALLKAVQLDTVAGVLAPARDTPMRLPAAISPSASDAGTRLTRTLRQYRLEVIAHVAVISRLLIRLVLRAHCPQARELS